MKESRRLGFKNYRTVNDINSYGMMSAVKFNIGQSSEFIRTMFDAGYYLKWISKSNYWIWEVK